MEMVQSMKVFQIQEIQSETVIYTISPSGPAPSFCAGSSFDYVVIVSPNPAPGTEIDNYDGTLVMDIVWW